MDGLSGWDAGTYGIGMVVADMHEVHAARHGGGHHVASSLIEDWLFDAGVCRAQCLVVAENALGWRDQAVTNQHFG